MASASHTVVVSVLGLSRLDGEDFGSHKGIGKSCLCSRFMYPGYDDYQHDSHSHCSLLALHEFESDVVHKDPFLYWGSTTRTYDAKGSSDKVNFEVLEYTVFYQDITEQPFRIKKSVASLKNYMEVVLTHIHESPGKISYKSRDLISTPQDYNSMVFPPGTSKHKRGFVIAIDVSDCGPTFESRLRLTKKMAEHLSSKKEKFVVVATKTDEMYLDTLDELKELARASKFTLIEVSAKSNVNVSETFEIVAAKVLGKAVHGLRTEVLAYPDAALKALSKRDSARRTFRNYLQKRVTVACELLKVIECTEEYKACAHMHGKFETGKMFAQHILTVHNGKISTLADVADKVGTRQTLLEGYVAERADLSPYANYLKDLIIKLCQKCSSEASSHANSVTSLALPPHTPSNPFPIKPCPHSSSLVTSLNTNATAKSLGTETQKISKNGDYRYKEKTQSHPECLPGSISQCQSTMEEGDKEFPCMPNTAKDESITTKRANRPVIIASGTQATLNTNTNGSECNSDDDGEYDYPWMPETVLLKNKSLPSKSGSNICQLSPVIPASETHATPSNESHDEDDGEYDFPWIVDTALLNNHLPSKSVNSGESNISQPSHLSPVISLSRTDATPCNEFHDEGDGEYDYPWVAGNVPPNKSLSSKSVNSSESYISQLSPVIPASKTHATPNNESHDEDDGKEYDYPWIPNTFLPRNIYPPPKCANSGEKNTFPLPHSRLWSPVRNPASDTHAMNSMDIVVNTTSQLQKSFFQLQRTSAQMQQTSFQEEEEEELRKQKQPLLARDGLPKSIVHSGVAVAYSASSTISKPRGTEDQAGRKRCQSPLLLQPNKGSPPKVKPSHKRMIDSLNQPDLAITPAHFITGSNISYPGAMKKPEDKGTTAKTTTNSIKVVLEPGKTTELAIVPAL